MEVKVYADAVANFLELARQGTGDSRVAAEVLLSAYNDFDFQVDTSGLRGLDRENFETAMVIIRGRYETGKEPHEVVANGGKAFRTLWDQWIELQVKQRSKVDCPRCDGRGRTYSSDSNDDGHLCTFCGGKGRVCECRL